MFGKSIYHKRLNVNRYLLIYSFNYLLIVHIIKYQQHMNHPNYKLDEIKDTFIWRLAKEHQLIHQLTTINSDLLEYEVQKNAREYPSPPVEYKIRYKFKSIVAVDENSMPVYGKGHEMLIRLPKGYPLQTAECKMLTSTWHPNIKAKGPYKGTICTNHKDGGSLYQLDELVIRIGEYLQYKKYLAENVAPYPEDQEVAQWVREVAEPQGIVNKERHVFIDNTPWHYVQLEDLASNVAAEEEPKEEDMDIIIEEITDENSNSNDQEKRQDDESEEDGDDIVFID